MIHLHPYHRWVSSLFSAAGSCYGWAGVCFLLLLLILQHCAAPFTSLQHAPFLLHTPPRLLFFSLLLPFPLLHFTFRVAACARVPCTPAVTALQDGPVPSSRRLMLELRAQVKSTMAEAQAL